MITKDLASPSHLYIPRHSMRRLHWIWAYRPYEVDECMVYEFTGLHDSMAGPWTPSLSVAGLLEICSVIRTLFHSWSLPTLLWVNLGAQCQSIRQSCFGCVDK